MLSYQSLFNFCVARSEDTSRQIIKELRVLDSPVMLMTDKLKDEIEKKKSNLQKEYMKIQYFINYLKGMKDRKDDWRLI